jgi:hypothetical protein
MTEILTIMPIVALMIYNIGLLLSGGIDKYWWKVLIFAGGVVSIWYFIHIFLNDSLTNLVVMLLLTLVSFELLQVRNYKMSLSFQLLFILTVALLASSAYIYSDLITVIVYILLFIYLLAESNQRYMKKNYEESASQYQNMVLSKQVSEVQNIYMTMRGWRHDYHNHLQTLKAYMKMQQINEAARYLDKLD